MNEVVLGLVSFDSRFRLSSASFDVHLSQANYVSKGQLSIVLEVLITIPPPSYNNWSLIGMQRILCWVVPPAVTQLYSGAGAGSQE